MERFAQIHNTTPPYILHSQLPTIRESSLEAGRTTQQLSLMRRYGACVQTYFVAQGCLLLFNYDISTHMVH